jgi:uncharacterized protein with gpF-like domain
MWFKKKKQETQHPINVYTVLNNELIRLHSFMKANMESRNADNATIIFRRIEKIQDALLEALEKQPSHDEAIKDLQQTVAEMLLLKG